MNNSNHNQDSQILSAASHLDAGISYMHEKQYEKAIQSFQTSIDILKETEGEQHYSIADSYNSIAFAYYYLKQYEKSLEFAQKSLDIRKNTFGEKQSNTAVSYQNIGKAYRELGQSKEAIESFQKSLDIYQEIPEGNLSTLALLNPTSIAFMKK